MPYYLNDAKMTLDQLKSRIKETDLVPSRQMLMENLDESMRKLEMAGVYTLSEFRKAVKTSKNLVAVSEKTTIGMEYLTVLRREVESYFPKAYPLGDFSWLDHAGIARLIEKGYKNSALLYEAVEASGTQTVFESLNSDPSFGLELSSLVNLTRIQWVSPITAKMLFEAGYENARSVAEACPEKLCAAIDAVNAAHTYFKGKIGLRDVKRLVKSAGYVVMSQSAFCSSRRKSRLSGQSGELFYFYMISCVNCIKQRYFSD